MACEGKLVTRKPLSHTNWSLVCFKIQGPNVLQLRFQSCKNNANYLTFLICSRVPLFCIHFWHIVNLPIYNLLLDKQCLWIVMECKFNTQIHIMDCLWACCCIENLNQSFDFFFTFYHLNSIEIYIIQYLDQFSFPHIVLVSIPWVVHVDKEIEVKFVVA